MFVSQWLTGVLADISSETNSSLNRICKKVRDDVVWESARLPFRRSPLWMTAKVVLQLLLVNTLDASTAMLLYKALILRFLCSCFLEEKLIHEIDTDTAMQMIAKIVRRVRKLDHLITIAKLLPDSPFFKFAKISVVIITKSIEETRSILDKRWAAIIEKERSEARFAPSIIPTHKEFLAGTQHEVSKLQCHIELLKKSTLGSGSSFAGYQPAPEETPIRSNVLYETETLELNQLREWSCRQLRDRYDKYLNKAFEFYSEKDAFGGSRMVLTLLKLIRVLDEKATAAHPLLKQHEPGIDPTLIHAVLLPLRSDMEMANALEEYFEARQKSAIEGLPSLIGEKEITPSSYSVRHAQSNEQMKRLKASILQMSNEKEREKLAELEREQQRYIRLTDEVASMECECPPNWRKKRKKRRCVRCTKWNERNAMRVKVYERPLRAEEQCRDAVVFELLAPIEIVCLRECLYRFNSEISRSLRCNNKSDWFGFWTDNEQQLKQFRGDTCSDQIYYRLGSHIKLFMTSHYSELAPTPSEPNHKFIVDNGFHCDFFNDRKELCEGAIKGSVSRFCTFKVESSSKYSSLQLAVDDTYHSQNNALSRLNDCPVELSLSEFREFGSLRSGHRLQLRNLYRAIFQGALSLKSKSVLALVQQSL